MKSIWADALELVKKSGVESVTLRYVSSDGTLMDAVAPIDSLTETSLEEGIQLENGGIVFPNPNTAILNPFLDQPAISFICELQKKSLDPVRNTPLPRSETAKTASPPNSLTAPVPSIFPLTVAGRPVKDMGLCLNDQSDSIEKQHQRRVMEQMAAARAAHINGGSYIMQTMSGGSVAGNDSHRGTSCHQCKNARPMTQLAFCSTMFNKRTSADMRNCRKKFCQGCLTKFYGDAIENSHKQGWICPSCRGICRCAACARKRRKNKEVIGAAFQQVAGSQMGTALQHQMRSLSNLILPDEQSFMHNHIHSNGMANSDSDDDDDDDDEEDDDEDEDKDDEVIDTPISDSVTLPSEVKADHNDNGGQTATIISTDIKQERSEIIEHTVKVEKEKKPLKSSPPIRASRRSTRTHPYAETASDSSPAKRSLRSNK